jgi:hypothetical protein
MIFSLIFGEVEFFEAILRRASKNFSLEDSTLSKGRK